MSRLDTFVHHWVERQKPAKSVNVVQVQDAIMKVWPKLKGIESVLDVGCAGGEALQIFANLGIEKCQCVGVTNQRIEYGKVVKKGFPCVLKDMHFLNTKDNRFDLVFSRRTVEHSPVPFYLLSEFTRISKRWVYLITPYYPCRMEHKDHCAVLPAKVWIEWGKRLGLKEVWKTAVEVEPKHKELRLLMRKR